MIFQYYDTKGKCLKKDAIYELTVVEDYTQQIVRLDKIINCNRCMCMFQYFTFNRFNAVNYSDTELNVDWNIDQTSAILKLAQYKLPEDAVKDIQTYIFELLYEDKNKMRSI